MDIPQGNSREEVRMRDKIIKDFYAGWIAENPEKKMWNDDLQDYILVKYLSITETADGINSTIPIKQPVTDSKARVKNSFFVSLYSFVHTLQPK